MSAEAPWLSVIVPIYNAKKYIKKCVNSVLAQSFSDFELLLIDDGSTDGSEAICGKYAEADSRVRYFRKENGGCFQSRLFGMERARGTYILNCDADDYYLTRDAFSILHSYTEQYSPEAVEFGAVQRNPIREIPLSYQGPAVCLSRDDFSARDYPRLLCGRWKDARILLNIWSKLFHKSLLSKLPPAESAERLFHGEDIVLNLHLLENVDRFLLIPERLYAHRPVGGTKRFLPNEIVNIDLTRRYQLCFWEKWDGGDLKDAALATMHERAANSLYRFAQKGLRSVSEQTLFTLLHEALTLPCIQKAQEYWLEHPENRERPIDLLREAEPQTYIDCAKAQDQTPKIGERFRALVAKL